MVNVNCALQHILLSYPQTPTAPYSAAFAIGLGLNLYLGMVANDALWHTLPVIGFVLYLLFSWRQLMEAWSRPAS